MAKAVRNELERSKAWMESRDTAYDSLMSLKGLAKFVSTMTRSGMIRRCE